MLTPSQREAIERTEGAVLVVAGPGSGKTTVLTQRVYALIQKTKPERILVITFARKAAEEMKQRFAKLAGEEAAAKVMFGTFHSVFYRWLRKWQVLTEKTQILDEALEKQLWHEMGWDMKDVPAFLMDKGDAWQQYQRMKKDRALVDFEDLIELTLKEIGKHSVWKEYDYVLIDEFQDINLEQYQIVRRMVRPEAPNLFVVGDEDQAIYAFRGAKPELFLHFAKDFPDCHRIDLTTNFRSQAHIVRAAQELIRYNQKRFDKSIEPCDPAMREEVKLYIVKDEKEEAKRIRNQLEKMKYRGIPYREMAVLCRTQSQLCRIGAALEEAGIPYESREELIRADYDELLIKRDLEVFWRLSRHPEDRQAFQRMIKWIKQLMYAGNWRRVPEGEAILSALQQQPMEAEIRREIAELERRLEKGKKLTKQRAFWYWLLQTDYLTYVGRKRKERGLKWKQVWRQMRKKQEAGKVFLSTMHGAKGLEFDLVWVAGLVEGQCPRKEAIQGGDLGEERRLLYVAMTRARKHLLLSCYDGLGMEPSRFLREIKSLQIIR